MLFSFSFQAEKHPLPLTSLLHAVYMPKFRINKPTLDPTRLEYMSSSRMEGGPSRDRLNLVAETDWARAVLINRTIVW